MIQAHDNSWWIVFHGYRTVSDKVHHILGRETCLAPVSWPRNGWPVVNGNGVVTPYMDSATLPLQPFAEKPSRTEFNEMKLGLDWNYIQYPEEAHYSFTTQEGHLSLRGVAATIQNYKPVTFVGRRLEHFYYTATTELDFNPENENEESGLILLNNGTHFDIMVSKKGRKRLLTVKLQFGQTLYRSKEIELKPGPVKLRIKGEKTSFTFSYAQSNDLFKDVETVDSKFIATETVGWFTGVYVGLYATGNGKTSESWANFDWFEYKAETAPKN